MSTTETTAREPFVNQQYWQGEQFQTCADWMKLRDGEDEIAEMFHVAYCLDSSSSSRPVTFVFNGGPGAASAYLHMGALGPKRIAFPDDGSLPPSPVKLVENKHSWLAFTDLVFVDPIGTGFSRTLEQKKDADGKELPEAKKKRKEFWNVKRDLESLGEFMRRWLTQHKRWASPIFIAGESYGGFRTARLVKQLQESDGIGLSGAILISPAIEFSTLFGNDYDILYWIDRFPSMAAAAHFHECVTTDLSFEEHVKAAEVFARQELVVALVSGSALAADQRRLIYQKASAFIGLDYQAIAASHGRIDAFRFRRELLAHEGKILGLYDASVTAVDPFPNRLNFEGPDPTLAGLSRLFTAAIHLQLSELGVDEQIRSYQLLNYDVFENWSYDVKGPQKQGALGAADELKYGMSLNPDMKVWVTHGYFDLITPYFTSNRLVDLLSLDEVLEKQMLIKHFMGGHMFYTWKQSRQEFYHTAQGFYQDTTAG